MALSQQEFDKLKNNLSLRTKPLNISASTDLGYSSNVGNKLKSAFGDITSGVSVGQNISKGGTTQLQQGLSDIRQGNFLSGIKDSAMGFAKEKVGDLKSKLAMGGGVARGLIAPIEEAPIIKQTLEGIGRVVSPVIESGLETDTGQRLLALQKQYPEAFKSIQDVIDITGLIPIGGGVKVGANVLEKGTKGTIKATENILSKVPDIASGIKDVATPAFQTIKNIPNRASINIAERKIVESSIKNLPTQSAKMAVREGVELPDIQYLYNIPKSQKQPLNKLFTAVEDFSAGKSKINPIEVVGKPIVNRIKTLETKTSVIGKRLGDTANKLPDVSDIEIQPVVLGELQKVNGLNGLSIADDGLLDFSNTSLASSLSKADQSAIQSAFTESIKSGTGKSKHLLRQELFEILGGKKKALVNITDTQEKAFNAIRKGLSDVLESKDVAYKTLSNEYRKTIQPLQEIRKFMKNVVGADEDILDMSAGLLARRLTSNAGSNPQLRQILRNLDGATKIKGKTSLSIETLQDFYNVVEKYYPEITGRTTLKGQVEGAIDSVTGLGDLAVKVGQKLVGKSDAVKRKALKDAILDALK